ncbi:MAG TPA: SGNH/GDSL hydrolase family protein [Chloroflexota bacterium]|nr:SGNH/GDSL hydrolase family protein [Chloroflexota bacterium]
MIFSAHQKLLFIGDSITDCGRRTEPHAPYGNGYVHLTRAFLLARYPQLALQIVNRGISGNTVRDLARRWEEDVIEEQPDWLSVKIGINDVWRTMTRRFDEAVPLEEYEATYRRLLTETKARTRARLILMEPYVIAPPSSTEPAPGGLSLEAAQRRYVELREQNITTGPEFEAAMGHFRAMMDTYIAAVHRLAREFDAVLVPTQDAFDEVMAHQPPAFWAIDRVHPGAPGHAVIARAFLRATGYGDV